LIITPNLTHSTLQQEGYFIIISEYSEAIFIAFSPWNILMRFAMTLHSDLWMSYTE